LSLNKKAELQDFFSARNSSSYDVERKFGVTPSEKGKSFVLKNGSYSYSAEDVSLMIKKFKEASGFFSGKKSYPKRMM